MNKHTEQNKEIEIILDNPLLRAELARISHEFFFSFYFPHYIKYPSAPFHKDLFNLTEDDKIKSAVILAFRGSAKSTLITLSYPLWAILGKQQKKFIVIVGQTERQARQHLLNIKRELEGNELLKNDLGPFKKELAPWGAQALVLTWHNACITAVSMEQTIRGMRFGQHRPDLIICDDIENLNSVRTKEMRDKIFNWITGEVIPAGDSNTKNIIVGNHLHEDSLIMRFKEKIENKKFKGVFLEIPLLDDKGKIAWPGKYPTMKDIEDQKNSTISETAFYREYMLQIISEEDRLIKNEWIQYYDKLPDKEPSFVHIGIDLAISKKSTADYTAMVTAYVYGYNKDAKIYIMPSPVYERLDFHETVSRIKHLDNAFRNFWRYTIFIEKVAYQEALIQHLNREGYKVEPFEVHGEDKKSRLATISHLIKDGKVLFPKKGAEILIQQLVNFGIEKHDDLADAFAIVIHKSLDKSYNTARGFPRGTARMLGF